MPIRTARAFLFLAALLAACRAEPTVIARVYNVTQIFATAAAPPATATVAGYPPPPPPFTPPTAYPGQLPTGTPGPTIAPVTLTAMQQINMPTDAVFETQWAATKTAGTATAVAAVANEAATAQSFAQTQAAHPTRSVENLRPVCQPAGAYLRCHDDLLGIGFEYPTQWGEISAQLTNGYTAGFAYEYSFSGAEPFAFAGGRSRDFSEPRDGGWTDFLGFVPDKAGDSGAALVCPGYGAKICNTLRPNELFMISFPVAADICDPGPGIIRLPVATIALDLPNGSKINGFVFATPVLSPATAAELTDILGPQGTAARPTGCTDPAKQQQFDARVQDLYANIQAGTADPGTLANVYALLRVAQSIHFD